MSAREMGVMGLFQEDIMFREEMRLRKMLLIQDNGRNVAQLAEKHSEKISKRKEKSR